MTTATRSRASLTERFAAHFPTSQKLFEQARTVFPNGVTHDLRYLEPFPIYVERALGAYKWDVDGHRLIDYWSGHGSLLLGHSHPAVVAAVQRQMGRATHPGGCHELEIEWGLCVQRLIPSAEKVRFVASGTEATLMALRLARIATGQPRILKFQGHFHGWHDAVIGAAHPPFDAVMPGIPTEVTGCTVAIPPNDVELVERTLQANPDIGTVILEPTGGRWGTVPIGGGFLRALRELTRRLNRVLIFDEVITGFRVAPGGAQGHYGVTPDLTTLAKVLAGGLPGGCVAGRADLMAALEFRPGKPKMKHPGTFNANPLSAAAGIATLEEVATSVPNRHANAMGSLLRRRLNELFKEMRTNWVAYGAFSGFRLLPNYDGAPPTGDDFLPYDGDGEKIDRPVESKLVHAFRCAMLLHGVDVTGLGGMTTAAHSEDDIEHTIQAVRGTLPLLR